MASLLSIRQFNMRLCSIQAASSTLSKLRRMTTAIIILTTTADSADTSEFGPCSL